MINKEIRTWHAHYSADLANDEALTLARLASWDLHNGPFPVGLCPACERRRAADASEGDLWGSCDCDPAEVPLTYPGFERACAIVAEYAAGLPPLYWSEDDGEISTGIPSEYCDACHGDGEIREPCSGCDVYGDDPDPDCETCHGEGETQTCGACKGEGYVDSDCDPIDSAEVRRAIFGSLAEYL